MCLRGHKPKPSFDMNISISSESCIKCGKCVKVCPASVFAQKPQNTPRVVCPDYCIGCGHCVMACPTDSVVHELFPPESVHVIDYADRPSADSLMLLLKSRRSNRVLKKAPVPNDLLRKIVEAASVAPTATNSMQVGYTVVTDKEKLKEITDYTLTTFEDMFKPILAAPGASDFSSLPPKIAAYVPLLIKMRKLFNAGDDQVLRNASAVILIHAPKTNTYGEIDCNLAYQNGSLMAEALGVSQVYAGFVVEAVKKNPEGLAKIIACEDKVCAVMILGMPKFKYRAYTDKKAPQVDWIE